MSQVGLQRTRMAEVEFVAEVRKRHSGAVDDKLLAARLAVLKAAGPTYVRVETLGPRGAAYVTVTLVCAVLVR